jgi:hypothetical protein
MDHITPIQRSLEDTVKHGELFLIFKELRWRGKVLLEDQIPNPYNLPRRFVKTHTCFSHSTANRLRCGSMSFHKKAMSFASVSQRRFCSCILKDKVIRQKYLTPCEEETLVRHVLEYAVHGYPLPIKSLRS